MALEQPPDAEIGAADPTQAVAQVGDGEARLPSGRIAPMESALDEQAEAVGREVGCGIVASAEGGKRGERIRTRLG